MSGIEIGIYNTNVSIKFSHLVTSQTKYALLICFFLLLYYKQLNETDGNSMIFEIVIIYNVGP